MEEEVIIEVHLFGDNANLLKGLGSEKGEMGLKPFY